MKANEKVTEMIRVIKEYHKHLIEDFEIEFDVKPRSIYLVIPMNDVNLEEISYSGVITMKEKLRLYVYRLSRNGIIDSHQPNVKIKGNDIRYKLSVNRIEALYERIKGYTTFSLENVEDN